VKRFRFYLFNRKQFIITYISLEDISYKFLFDQTKKIYKLFKKSNKFISVYKCKFIIY